MIFIGNIWLNYRLILRIFVGDITCKSWLNRRIEKWANGPSGVGFIFLGHLFWRFNTSFLRATKFYVPNFLAIEIGVQIELQGEEVSLERTTCYTMTNISFICFIYYYSYYYFCVSFTFNALLKIISNKFLMYTQLVLIHIIKFWTTRATFRQNSRRSQSWSDIFQKFPPGRLWAVLAESLAWISKTKATMLAMSQSTQQRICILSYASFALRKINLPSNKIFFIFQSKI